MILLFKLSTSQRVKSSSSYFQLGKVVGSISPPLILQFFVIVTGIVFSNSIFFMECTTKRCYIRTTLAVRHVMLPSSAHAFRCTVDTTTRWSDVKLPARACDSSLFIIVTMVFGVEFFCFLGTLEWVCKVKTVHVELVTKKFMSSVFAPRFLIYIWK